MNPVTSKEPVKYISGDSRDGSAVWDQICESVSDHGHIYLFTDFDGTLADITNVPGAAMIDDRSRAALRRLATERRVTVVVLSGRSVPDVADRVGLPVIYGGDHGLEIHGPDFDFVAPGAESIRLELPAICNAVRQRTAHIPGTLIEMKRFTASVHFRQVPPDLVPKLLDIVRNTIDEARFEIADGQCVFEIRPRIEWRKGHAVQWILERNGATSKQAICIGDDVTDEDMFQRVPAAVNVRVSATPPAKTSARYCMVREDVPGFLEGIREVLHGLCSASSAEPRVPWHSDL